MTTDLEKEREAHDRQFAKSGAVKDWFGINLQAVSFAGWMARAALAAPAAPMKTPDVGSWREEFSKRIYANLAAADNQDVPLEEYPGRILAVMDGMGVAPYKVAIAYETLKAAMREDQSYAWSWHCNLAMPIMDAIHCSQQQANEAAARLMRHLFDIDVTSFREWEPFAAPAAPQERPNDTVKQATEALRHLFSHLGGADQDAYSKLADALEGERLAAPQEQPSDRDIALIWDQSTDEIDVPELRIQGDLLPLILAHSRALLSRYGAAPQGGEDARGVPPNCIVLPIVIAEKALEYIDSFFIEGGCSGGPGTEVYDNIAKRIKQAKESQL